jgi:hypothetical protein
MPAHLRVFPAPDDLEDRDQKLRPAIPSVWAICCRGTLPEDALYLAERFLDDEVSISADLHACSGLSCVAPA